MTRLWYDAALRRRVREQVKALTPWYQGIYLGAGIWTRPWNRETLGEWYNAERGGRKWNRFILPMIGPYLKGAVVVELGTNASHNLVLALRAGARLGIGIEPDQRYFDQGLLVRHCLGLQNRLHLVRDIEEAGTACFFEGTQWDFQAREKRIGLLCAVLRHIPEGERVETLGRMGRLCKRILIQSNGRADGPGGDNPDSVVKCVHKAGLKIVSIMHENHVRGFVVLAERQ